MKEMLQQVIEYWRNRHSELDQSEKQKVYKPFYFISPIQIEVFRLHNSAFNQSVQLWIISQFPNLPDCDIKIHEIETLNIQTAIPALLKNERYDMELKMGGEFNYFDEPITYRLAIGKSCERAIRVLDRKLHGSLWGINKPNANRSYGYYSGELWTCIFEQDPTLAELLKDVDDTISQIKYKNPAMEIVNKSINEIPQQHYKLVGSYIYPPAWVGSRPTPEPRQLVDAAIWGYDFLNDTFHNIKCESETRKLQIAVTQDGLIAMEGENKELFIRYFNTIVGLLNMVGGNYLTVRENELAYSHNPPEQLGTFYGLDHMVGSARMTPWTNRNIFTRIISKDELDMVLSHADILMNDTPRCDLVLLYAEASSHFLQQEYTQSLLWSWILLEKCTSLFWTRYVSENKFPPKLIEAFEGENISRDLRILRKIGIVDRDVYREIENIRQLRNKVVHSGVMATEEQGSKSIKMCEKLLNQLIGEIKPVRINEP